MSDNGLPFLSVAVLIGHTSNRTKQRSGRPRRFDLCVPGMSKLQPATPKQYEDIAF